MTITKKVLILLVSLALITTASAKKHKGHHGKNMIGPKVMKQLDLTKEQQAKFKEFSESNKVKMKGNREALRTARENLQTAFAHNDKAKVEIAKKALIAAETKLIEDRVSSMNFVFDNISKEQQTKLMSILSEKKANKKGNKGNKAENRDCNN